MWSDVKDFKWLRREKSPNWELLDQQEQVAGGSYSGTTSIAAPLLGIVKLFSKSASTSKPATTTEDQKVLQKILPKPALEEYFAKLPEWKQAQQVLAASSTATSAKPVEITKPPLGVPSVTGAPAGGVLSSAKVSRRTLAGKIKSATMHAKYLQLLCNHVAKELGVLPFPILIAT